MPGPEDPLRSELERLATPADPAGAYERIVEKKIRRQIYRKLQVIALALVVLAGTIGGSVALTRVFRPDPSRVAEPPPKKLTGNGEIAFVGSQEGGPRIYAISPDGTRLALLTTGQGARGAPAWAPDGSTLAFSSTAEGGLADIFVMDADGTGPVNLTKSASVIEEDPAWSPEGRRIAFISNRAVSYEVWVMNADGSGAKRLTGVLGAGVRHPAWSPDGKRIAFSAPDFGAQTWGGIFVMNADGSDIRQIFREQTCCVFDILGPSSWSPDGRRIVFTRDNHNGNIGDTGIDLYAVRADGSDLVQLTDDTVSGSPSWSPDGKHIVFARDDGLYVMDSDGKQQAKVPDAPAGASSPAWRPTVRSLPGPPSPPPPSLPSPPSPPALGSECDATTVNGDFSGDGLVDTATVAKTSCLFFPEKPSYPFDHPFALEVRWGGGSAGTVPLPDCQEICEAFASADLNDDGSQEFVLLVGTGASTSFFEIYELPLSEAFGQHPSSIAPPGAPGYEEGAAAVFAMGGSVPHLDFLSCTPSEAGTQEVHAISYLLNHAQTEYAVHSTIFTFDLANIDGEFVVVSTHDFTFAFDPTGQNVPEAGPPCWDTGSSPSPGPSVP